MAGESGFAAKAVHRNRISCIEVNVLGAKQFEGNLPDARVQPQMGARVCGGRQSSGEEGASAIVAAATEALHTRGIGWRQMQVVHVRPPV